MLTLIPSNGHSPAVIVANDNVSLADIKTTLRLIARHHCEHGVIWDMRQARLGELHCQDIKDVVETIAAVLPQEDAYRVAIIGNGTLQFGLFRAFQTYAEFAGLKREYGYFADPADANAWVLAHPSLKTGGAPWPSSDLTALIV